MFTLNDKKVFTKLTFEVVDSSENHSNA